jgi:branched-chain amino acid transport system ATP-binding protein
MAEAAPLLALEHVRAGYGDTVVLDGVDVTVRAGGILAILGRNGVGKTTLLTTIMGHTRLHSGRIMFDGVDIAKVPIYERARRGIGLVPQERRIFPSLTVTENLEVAQQPGRWTMSAVYELFPNLAERRNNLGCHLSGGEQQMLSIGRALMGNPRLLLMDEPSEGLAPVIVEQLVAAMEEVRAQEGISIILVEQHSRLALSFAENAVIVDRGRVVYDGASAVLLDDAALLARLIGVAE